MQKSLTIVVLISLLLFSCKNKDTISSSHTDEPETTVEATPAEDAANAMEAPATAETKTQDKNELFQINRDISGRYELVEGYEIIDGVGRQELVTSIIVFEKTSQSDYRYYYADKFEGITPLGYHNLIRHAGGKFFKLEVKEYTDDFGNDLKVPFFQSEVKLVSRGHFLGMIIYGGNFKKYLWYKKMPYDEPLIPPLKNVIGRLEKGYKAYYANLIQAENYDGNRVKVSFENTAGTWKTTHAYSLNDETIENNYYASLVDLDEDPENVDRFIETVEQFSRTNHQLIFQDIPVQSLPLIENTNFDDFIEQEDYKDLDEEELRIAELYRDYDPKIYKAIRAYRIQISPEFYSLLVTIKKGDHEMETLLVNYDLLGHVMDHVQVSYDEIAEGQSRVKSKITNDFIHVNYMFYGNEPSIEQQVFQIMENGKLESMSAKGSIKLPNMPMINLALEELKIDLLETNIELIASKPHPDNPDEYIIVIPEIAKEEADYLDMYGHILIINGSSGQVMNKLIVGGPTQSWVSDAVQLKSVTIDTAPYYVTPDTRAFGIRTFFANASNAVPYELEELTLYVKSSNTLNKVLDNYEVQSYGGESFEDCSGFSSSSETILLLTDEKTNDYFHIKAIETTTNTAKHGFKDGECQEEIEVTKNTAILTFNGTTYVENK